MTSGTVVTLNNLPSFVLKLTIFSRLRLEKNNQFQDFTRADYLVQRPAFGHYLINNIFLGLKGNSVRIKFVNTVIIFMKYVIYKSRQKGSLPTLVKIEKSVLELIEEEKKLAIKMGNWGCTC